MEMFKSNDSLQLA